MGRGRVLHCYAPGDGALSLVWLSPGPAVRRVATGDPVHKTVARRFLTTEKGKELVAAGYRLYYINFQARLVRLVQRLGENRLRMEGKVYDYQTTDPRPEWFRHTNTSFTFTLDGSGGQSTHVLRNHSVQDGLLFFLNHEGVIIEQEREGP